MDKAFNEIIAEIKERTMGLDIQDYEAFMLRLSEWAHWEARKAECGTGTIITFD